MEADPSRLVWQDRLPADVDASVRPFEDSARDAYEWYKANDYLEKAGVRAVA